MSFHRSLLAGAAVFACALPVHAQTVLMSQPTWTNGIWPHFSVAGTRQPYNPVGTFFVRANQPNPFRTDSNYVPVTWDVGSKTGLTTGSRNQTYQAGIKNSAGHTAAQIGDGAAIGAYLNSVDLINGQKANHMMISPNFVFPTPLPPVFAKPNATMTVSLDLQVPTAIDQNLIGRSETWAKIDLLFNCTKNNSHFGFTIALFDHNSHDIPDGIGFDPSTQTAQTSARASLLSTHVNLLPGSATIQFKPWTGFKKFVFTISQAQFVKGLSDAAAFSRQHGYVLSLDPADWVLYSTHLNAEMAFTATTPAAMAWSMQNLTLTAQ